MAYKFKELLDKTLFQEIDFKQRIRERYRSADISESEVMPIRKAEELEENTSVLRVVAYFRVGASSDELVSTYELQKIYWTAHIKAQPRWEFAGIYVDEGRGDSFLKHQKGMQQLIEDCKAGKIDLIITKSIARFARDISESLSVIEILNALNPPVGIKFEEDHIYTLDSYGRMVLAVLRLAMEEDKRENNRTAQGMSD